MATQIVINDPVSQRHLAAPVIAVVSSDANNALRTGSDGNLFVQGSGGGSGSTQPLVSQQPGNYATYGNDLGVYVGGQEILSNGRTNLLHLSDRDGRIELTKDDLEDAGIGGGGTIKPDVDQLKSDMSIVKSDVSTVKSDVNNVKSDVTTLRRDVDTNTRDIADLKAGATDVTQLRRDVDKNTSDISVLKNDIQNITVVSTDRNNIITVGRDGGAYLDSNDVVVDVHSLINSGDPLLKAQNDKLVSGLSMRYNSTTGLVEIIGVHGSTIASTTIPTALTMLESISLVDNPAGQPAGTYIHFRFRLSDGSTSDMYLNVNKLVQAYSAGDGINIDTTGKISVNHDFVEDIVDDVIDTELGTRGKITTAVQEAVDEAVEDITIVSANRNNIITKGTDNGAMLTGEKIVEVIGDSIEELAVEAIEQAIEDGKVHIVSRNVNNQITVGTDGGAYLAKSTIATAVKEEIDAKNINLVSTDADNLLKTGNDGRPYLDPDDVPSGVSTDIGNALKLGSDNKPFFPSDYGTL